MESDAQLYRERLSQNVGGIRKLLVAAIIFALAIVVAGSLNRVRSADLTEKMGTLSASLPKSWEPLESFYTRSGPRLEAYADSVSTRWANLYVTMTTYMVALEQLTPNPTLARNLDRMGDLSRNINQYNSDIRAVLAAKRRQLSFRQLSKPELQAVLRIVTHRFSPQQQQVVDETSRNAAVILRLADGMRAQRSNETDLRSRILVLGGEPARSLVTEFARGARWSEAVGVLLMDDLYYSRAELDDAGAAGMRAGIDRMPRATIGEVESAMASLSGQRDALADESIISLPLVGVDAPARYLTWSIGGVTLLFLLTLLYLIRQARTAVGHLRSLDPPSKSGAAAIILQDIPVGSHGLVRNAAAVLVLCSPFLAGLVLFREQFRDLPAAVSAVILLLAQGVLAAKFVRDCRSVKRLAEPAGAPAAPRKSPPRRRARENKRGS